MNVFHLTAWLGLLTLGAHAAVNPADFTHYQDVRAPDPLPGPDALAALVLSDDVFAELNLRATNLRLLEADQREVPYLLRPRTERLTRTEERIFPVAPLAFREMKDNRAEIVVARPAEPGVPVALLLHSGQANYEKRITVSGSQDQQNWTTLTEAQPVFDYTRYVDVRNNRVNLPSGEWAFYRIEISNLAEDRKAVFTEVIRQLQGGAEQITETETARIRQEPFRVERLELVMQQERMQSERPVLIRRDVPEFEVHHDSTAHVTRVEFVTRRQPVVAVWVYPRDRNFSRQATVSGTDESGPNASWEGLANATLTRIEAAAGHQPRLKLELGEPRRYARYRIVLHNQDNPPLEIESVQAETETWEALFFSPAGPVRLYYGGPLAVAPQYDIGAVLAASPRPEPQLWTASPSAANPAYREPAPPKAPRSGRALMVLAILAMVALLFVVIAKAARQVE